MPSYSQETSYLYKPGDPSFVPSDAHVRDRLSEAQQEETNTKFLDQRLSRFLEARAIIEKSFHKLNETHLNSTLEELSRFVMYSGSEYDKRLPLTILEKADVKAYITKIRQYQPRWHTVSIHSKECPNLKSTIKLIVNRFTEKESHLVLDKRLTYDFNVLIDWLAALSPDPSAERLLVVVEDADGFDLKILRGLVAHMHSYVSSRELSLHLLLNLSTPLSLLEENLSQQNIVSTDVQVLQGLPPVTLFIEDCQREFFESNTLKLRLSGSLLEKLFVVDIPQAAKYLHYAILGHFAGNPLASITSAEQLLSKRGVVERIPSVYVKNTSQNDFLEKLVAKSPDLDQLCIEIPELQVGGAILDVVFDPNYRPLIEQALTDPRTWCSLEDPADRLSVPGTVLYQLTRESSVYINIFDLYCAFKEMSRPINDCLDWDRQIMAIFLETVTAFKILGILRDCKRKFECVEKVSWKGV